MITCTLRSLNSRSRSRSMDISTSTSTNININTTARHRRLRISTTAAVRLNRTGDSTDSRLRDRRARMDILVHLHPGRRVAIGVVVRRRLHRVVVGSRVLDSDLEGDSILPRVRMDNLLLLGHLAGAGIPQDTELLQCNGGTEWVPQRLEREAAFDDGCVEDQQAFWSGL